MRLGPSKLAVVAAAAGVLVGLAPVAGPGIAAASGPAPSPATRAGHPIPQPHLTRPLRIRGSLRDGGLVRAFGALWKPGLLPHGDKLLSFEVTRTWFACRTATACRTAADMTSRPFAGPGYVVGHADVGRHLKLVETASEVVETDPATFRFVVVRATASRTTPGVVKPFRTGQPPRTEFVDGVPEQHTGSDSEYFTVDAPHYPPGAGTPTMSYRIDAGPWRPMPADRVFYTGLLHVGPHTVRVRVADRTRALTEHFHWQVRRLPAPVPCQGHCWLPPHLNKAGKPLRWDWQIGRVTPLERTGKSAVDLYDLDGFLTTAAEVRTIHTTWQAATLAHPKVACYLDLAWEDYRPDGSPGQRLGFPRATLGKVYFGFPQERFVDFRQLSALKPMIDARLEMCARKGFDAVELDDIDTFDPPSTTGFHLTPGDAQNLLAYAFNEAHRLGLAGLWKNTPLLTWWGRRYTDGAIIEECYAFRQCSSWRNFTTDPTAAQPSGKWVGEVEYGADHVVCDPGQHHPGQHHPGQHCTGQAQLRCFLPYRLRPGVWFLRYET